MTTDEKIRRLEERVHQLESELHQVRGLVSADAARPWWERTAGMFKDDSIFAEIVRLGRAARRAGRSRARKAPTSNGRRRQIKPNV